VSLPATPFSRSGPGLQFLDVLPLRAQHGLAVPGQAPSWLPPARRSHSREMWVEGIGTTSLPRVSPGRLQNAAWAVDCKHHPDPRRASARSSSARCPNRTYSLIGRQTAPALARPNAKEKNRRRVMGPALFRRILYWRGRLETSSRPHTPQSAARFVPCRQRRGSLPPGVSRATVVSHLRFGPGHTRHLVEAA
jgi:hypothetical protein